MTRPYSQDLRVRALARVDDPYENKEEDLDTALDF
jgi:hypothetical protein